MEAAMEIESDFSEVDEETDQAVQEYLNDTLAESVQAQNKSCELIYTPEQLEDIALYKKAIALNRESEATYRKLEDSLYKMLNEIRKRLKENEAALLKETSAGNEGGFSYLRSGKPYFKDKFNFSAPDNEDTIFMKKAKMYDFSQVGSVPGWTVKDKTELVNALQELSRNIREKELKSEIARLRRENKNENLMEIAKLEREITQLHNKSLKELALPLDQEYDWEALANSLNRRHTAKEYQSLWKLFFHPSINKSNWSKTEHNELQKIATAFNMQDWDAIAEQLNTGRTGYQCFVYYRTNMVDVSSNRRWTSEEVEYLQRVIDYYKEGTYIPWGKVATAMDNRTKIQVYNKYTRMTERRKGRFLEEEDIVILNCYERYGEDFKKISEFLPGRSPLQLRTRFNLLTKFRVSKTWTIHDDKKLIQIMANLESNSNFSTATMHFPGKDRMHIRSRYITLMKWMKAHPATDLSLAPRRGARRLVHGHAATNLNEAVAKLNKRIETEVRTKKTKRITKHSREEDIEDGIMAALINEIIKEEASIKPDYDVGEISSFGPLKNVYPQNMTNLRKLLVFLNASLDKKKFVRSKYAKKFPELGKTAPEASLVKVKSYSKKQSVKTIQLEETPDIWGNLILEPISYVLPPNYATITGCRVLMKNYGSQPDANMEDEVNLSLMSRRNAFLKDALCILKERFTALFLWPILLSNELPNVTPPIEEIYVPKPTIQQKFLPQPDEVTIPTYKKSYLDSQTKQSKQIEEGKHTEKIDDAEYDKQDFNNDSAGSSGQKQGNSEN